MSTYNSIKELFSLKQQNYNINIKNPHNKSMSKLNKTTKIRPVKITSRFEIESKDKKFLNKSRIIKLRKKSNFNDSKSSKEDDQVEFPKTAEQLKEERHQRVAQYLLGLLIDKPNKKGKDNTRISVSTGQKDNLMKNQDNFSRNFVKENAKYCFTMYNKNRINLKKKIKAEMRSIKNINFINNNCNNNLSSLNYISDNILSKSNMLNSDLCNANKNPNNPCSFNIPSAENSTMSTFLKTNMSNENSKMFKTKMNLSRSKLLTEYDSSSKRFLNSVKHSYVGELREKFNRMYGLNKEFNDEMNKLKFLRQDNEIDIGKYQEEVLKINNMNVSEDYLYNLYKDLRHIKCQTENIKPLPPVDFNSIVEKALKISDEEMSNKKKYVKQWKMKPLRLSDMTPEEREMYEISKEARTSNVRKGLREPKVFQLLPEYLVEALYQKRGLK